MPKESKNMKKVLVLLDMHAILHRAFHALPSFASPKGEPTGALYGFSTLLLKVIRELKPDYLVACYDLPGPTFRHVAYDEYKGKRPEIASELSTQIQRSYDLVKAFSIHAIEHPSFEADDMIGTLVEKTKKEKNLKVVIASGDLDTLQCVDKDRVQVYTLRKGLQDTILYNEARVRERFGFAPMLLPDFKGLKGDPSDNIIGVPGIGDKSASELIQKFGHIEAIYKLIKKNRSALLEAGIKERTVKLLEEHKEEALFSKTLAEIRRDAPIEFSLEKADWRKSFKREHLQDLFKGLGFMSLLSRLPEVGEPAQMSSDVKAEASANFLSKAKEIWWYFSRDRRQLLAVSRDKKLFWFDPRADIKRIIDLLRSDHEHYFFDAKSIFHAIGEAPVSVADDIRISAWLCRSYLQDPSLTEAIHHFLPKEFVAEANILKAAELLPELSDAISKELKEKKLERVRNEIEIPLIPVLFSMEQKGILVDLVLLKRISASEEKELRSLEKKIWKLAGVEFNIASPKQLGEVLYGKLGLMVKGAKKTAGGAPTTRESELLKMKGLHPIISEIMQYREISKLKSTYVDALPKLADASGRVHTTFDQTGASTGRLSSLEPNLQNIPIRSEAGREVRKVFIAPEGFELVAFDYSQIELRLAALLSKDKKMTRAFKEGRDIHTITASEIFNVSPDKVTELMRRKAKVINFGILYGMGINALAQAMDVNRAEAQKFWEEYFRDFEGVAQWIETIKKKARRDGYVETIFGRRRYIPEIHSSAEYIQKEAERMAVNAPVQGTAADIVKLGMIQADKFLQTSAFGKEAKLLLQIHDELLFEVRKSAVPNFIPEIKKILESVYKAEIPMTVETKVGTSWGEMRKWKHNA